MLAGERKGKSYHSLIISTVLLIIILILLTNYWIQKQISDSETPSAKPLPAVSFREGENKITASTIQETSGQMTMDDNRSLGETIMQKRTPEDMSQDATYEPPLNDEILAQ